MLELYSFDVFDTLITRKTATPKGTFVLMQKELINNNVFKDIPLYIKENFYNIRVQAEENLRYNNKMPIEEITFNYIYESIANCSSLNNEEKQLLKDLEISTEINNLIGIDSNISLVKQLLIDNKRVILISDMYLSGEQIRTLLMSIDEIFAKITIYSSSDFLKTKHTGNLYKIIANKEKINYKKWQHVGDNIHADVEMAKEHNISAVHYNYVQLEEYEQYALANSQEQDYVTQLTIGTAKNTRINNNDMFNLGASLSAPIFFMYVLWIIEQAVKLNINRLYFIARDGYILKEIADIIINQYGYKVNTQYIYGSRIAWRSSSINKIEDLLQCSWFNTWETGTIIDLLACLNIKVEEVMHFLPDKYHNFNKKLNNTQIKDVLKIIIEQNDFAKLVMNSIKLMKSNLLGYLAQVIDYRDNKFALVDLIGTGLSASLLSNIMQELIVGEIIFFYFQKGYKVNFNNRQAKFYQMVYGSKKYYHDIFEALARAPHGQTLGYKKDDHNYFTPLLEDFEGDVIIKYGFFDYLHGITAFVKNYLPQIQHFKFNPLKLELFYNYHDFLMTSPDKKTADLIGKMPFKVGGLNKNQDKYLLEYAPPFKWWLKHTNWLAGSHARSFNKYKKLTAYKGQLFKISISSKKRKAELIIFGKKVLSVGKIIFRNKI